MLMYVCFMHDVLVVVVAKWILRLTVVCYIGDVIVLWLAGQWVMEGGRKWGLVIKLVDLKLNGRFD